MKSAAKAASKPTSKPAARPAPKSPPIDRAAANWRRVFAMPMASLYPSYVAKAEKKGRTKAEVDQILCWLTGHTPASLHAELAAKTSVEAFITTAPALNPARDQVTGVVCGIRVETLAAPLQRTLRVLDKLVDELAKGKAMERVLRAAS